MTQRILISIVALTLAVLAYVNVSAAVKTAQVANELATFKSSICQVYSAQTRGGARFYTILRQLERRAVVREAAEKRAGDYLAASSDGDLARLYLSVLPNPRSAATPRPTLDCGGTT